MFRFPLAVWVAVFLLALVPYYAALPAAAGSCAICEPVGLSVEEQALWQQIAAARASAGLSPLTIDPSITMLARARSTDMAQHRLFGHTSSAGTTFLDMMPSYGLTGKVAGETIQMNNYTDPTSEAARDLIASPAHHAILFDPRYRIGSAGSAIGDDGLHYFTIIVIQP